MYFIMQRKREDKNLKTNVLKEKNELFFITISSSMEFVM